MQLGKISIKIYWHPPQFPASSGFEEIRSNKVDLSMLKLLSRSWWALVLRGVLSVLFGVAAYTWPVLTIQSLVFLFSLYALVDGFVLILHAISGWEDHPSLLIIQGLIGVGIGALTYEAPDVTALGLVFYIAIRSLIDGALDIVAAVRLRKEVKGEFWLIMAGMASILFAVVLLAAPVAGILAGIWIVAIYAVTFGVVMIVLGLRLRGFSRLGIVPA
jgi:uncharacterized membrane protein HdeD (DUF308 family)